MLFSARNNQKTNWVLSALVLYCGGVAAVRAEELARKSSTYPAKIVAGPVQPSGPRAAGLTIAPIYDTTITSDPRAADIKAAIEADLALYQNLYSDSVTVRIKFVNTKSGLGSSLTGRATVSYVNYRKTVLARATTVDDKVAVATLPDQVNNPVNNDPNMNLTTALARTLGLGGDIAPDDVDSTVSLNISTMNILATDNDQSKYSFSATNLHEIDEALGLTSSLDGGTTGPISPLDLYRYDKTGKRNYTQDPAAEAYFSLDGTTKLVRFNQDKTGDFGDYFSQNGASGANPQVQDAFGSPGGPKEKFEIEPRGLDVIGYTRVDNSIVTPPTVTPPAITSAATCNPNPTFTGTSNTFTVGASISDNSALTFTWDFGDSTTGTGASTTHVYTTGGTFNAVVMVKAINDAIVTSSVSVTVSPIKPATLVKKKFSLNFKSAQDAIDITMNNADFVMEPADPDIKIFIVGAQTAFDGGTLVKNKANGAKGKFTVTPKKSVIRYTATKATLQALLAPLGATDTPPSGTVSIPIFISFNGSLYGGTFDFTYTAKAGKSGIGK